MSAPNGWTDAAVAPIIDSMKARLELSRAQILAYRRRVGNLDERLPPGRHSLRQAAWAGLQDSAPRAALVSINARVEGTRADTWEDPHYVQLWGPRFSVYVVAAPDRAIFTLGRMPEDEKRRRRAEGIAARLRDLLGGEKMTYREAGRALGVPPNMLRYAAPTGTLLMRWEGAGQPIIWMVPVPDADPAEARLELARRYIHVFGPTTPGSFARWAGIPNRVSSAVFDHLESSLTPVRTPIQDAWILGGDEPDLRQDPGSAAPARLLPSGDVFFLLHGGERELLVPVAHRRDLLWPSRVWPGAVLLEGEVVGTWRRANEKLTIGPWRRLSMKQRDAIAAEATALPIPGLDRPLTVRWDD